VVELSQRSTAQLSVLGYHYGVAGRRDDALAIQKELEDRYAKREAVAQSVAAIRASLGDHDGAFAWLEKDFQAHSAELQFITARLQYDQLESDPRFTDLLRRMGIPR